MMRKSLFILLSLVTLSGCGTIEGVGQDISAASRRVAGWF